MVDVVIHLTLPWPPSTLSPNGAHGHWAVRARSKNLYREACYLSVLEQRVRCPKGDRFDVLLLFVPPDRRKYDLDNMIARAKVGLDGLCLAWGIDDSAFVRVAAELVDTLTPARGAAEVRVTVSEHLTLPLAE